MSATPALTPYEAIRRAHEATYPNAKTEEAAVQAVEKAVSEKVLAMEGIIARQATEHTARSHELRADADRLYNELVQLRREVERHGLTPELRSRWLALDNSVRAVIPSALAAMRRADDLAEKAADPFAALQQIFEFYPALGVRGVFGV